MTQRLSAIALLCLLLSACTTLPPDDDNAAPPVRSGDAAPLPPNPVIGMAPNVEVPQGGAQYDDPPPDIAPSATGAAPARLPAFVASPMAPPPAIVLPPLQVAPQPGAVIPAPLAPGHFGTPAVR